jgi:hypothetical protein
MSELKRAPLEVAELVALPHVMAVEAAWIMERTKKNPELLGQLRSWALSLTTTNCDYAEYEAAKVLISLGLMKNEDAEEETEDRPEEVGVREPGRIRRVLQWLREPIHDKQEAEQA